MTTTNALLLALVFFVFYLGHRSITSFVQRIGRERSIQPRRIRYIKQTLSLTWVFIGCISAISVTGKSLQDIGIIVGSSLAFLGVALFAQWSLLSNVTASVIVFFLFPYRVGDWVDVIDGDNSISGKITEITLFHVILSDDDDNTLTYPNSLVFQKAVRIGRNKGVPKREEENDSRQH
ncbi:MAG: mechanosensitive ion channel family protein [Cellvibrionaceae bacterium]